MGFFPRFFGKEHKIPRLQAWYADKNIDYTYSGKQLIRNDWNSVLSEIKTDIELITSNTFNSVLGNLYRNGSDSMGLHSDNEKELGENPAIASVSFGAERFFHLKHKNQKELRLKIPLTSGSLLLMEGETQTHWLHQVAKTSKLVGPRINLTFRKII